MARENKDLRARLRPRPRRRPPPHDLPGADSIWARYYEIGTDRPILGDRDKTIHDKVNEISLERRNGYSWYNNAPKRALEQYAIWSKQHP